MQLPLFKSLKFRLPFLVLLGVIPTTIIAIAIGISHTSQTIRPENQANSQTGYTFIVDEKGNILEHPDPNLTSGDEPTNYSSYPPVANFLEGKEGYFPFKDESGANWASYGTRLDNGWGVFLLQQNSEAALQEKELEKFAAIVGGAAILAAGIVTWLVANRLTQSINEIIEASSSFADGNFDQSVDMEREDEIGILAQSVNLIAKQLQHSFRDMQEHALEIDKLLKKQNLWEREQGIFQEKLERQARELETKLALVNQGDLTIKATLTDKELGNVANSYNLMVESLRKIIAQVKTASQIVAKTTNQSEAVIQNLSVGASRQTEEITAILAKIQTMAESMQTVAFSAGQAEEIIKQASAKVRAGDLAINEAVDKIVALGQTTVENKEQVKRLGKASRKISKAVELIRKIALQTNVLAVNTSIEAARAGEEGLGFTVVADEVQSLAAQSAQTATEIEKLVLEMQTETSKVIQAMEDSSKQVVVGSKQVEETRAALQQINVASQQINQLVATVNNVAIEQSQTSQVVSATIQEVAAIAQETSFNAKEVSTTFQEILAVASELQTSVGQFKVS